MTGSGVSGRAHTIVDSKMELSIHFPFNAEIDQLMPILAVACVRLYSLLARGQFRSQSGP
jgi:hypothetical protein